MAWVLTLILLGFALGVVAVIAAEALGLLWILKRLRFKAGRDQDRITSRTKLGAAELDPLQSLDFALKKKGVVWVLESEKVSRFLLDKPTKEQKRKLLEVSPVKMYGQINGQKFILREPDGLQRTIELKGCTVQAVSASSLSTKKWAKKFPIKLESKTSIYDGSKSLYIYLETSWEKEAWCKALHLASCDQQEKIKWFAQLNEEFHNYLSSLNSVFHSFMKPSVGSGVEAIERSSKPDGTSSKVRQFLKKISKRTSRIGLEHKSSWASLSSLEEKKSTEKLRASQDVVLATGFMKTASTGKHLKSSLGDDALPASSKSSQSGGHSHHSVSSDVDVDEKFGIDEGTLCLNLLISRLFFDAKSNTELKRSIQSRIQRTLSNMRIPSYIGEIICTNINTGNVPPCIAGMRALPMELSEVWAFEVDIEYSGGAVLEIETRLEVCELELQRDTEDTDSEPSNDGAVPSDLIEGFEYLGEQLNLEESNNDLPGHKDDGDSNTDVYKSLKSIMSSSTHGSRWKSILNSLAKQVSEVPISLAIRVESLRGTLRLHIKPPPSDQLWYGFTSMPEIDFKLESSVGERKITSGHIASFLVNRIKTAIWETLVLPNCEYICLSWMLAEKDDWVPQSVAPFIWTNHGSGNESSADTKNQPSGGVKSSASTLSNDLESKQKSKSPESSLRPARKSSDSVQPLSSSTLQTLESRTSDELIMPLLEKNDNTQETTDSKQSGTSSQNDEDETSEQKMECNSEIQSSPRSFVTLKQNSSSIENEDGMPRKMGRRERMNDLRRKMGEKLEEKRRHIEEKSRHIVEKMRGPSETQTK